jgi:hypothetical protein
MASGIWKDIEKRKTFKGRLQGARQNSRQFVLFKQPDFLVFSRIQLVSRAERFFQSGTFSAVQMGHARRFFLAEAAGFSMN